MTIMRDSFIFYRGWADVANDLPNNIRLSFYDGIIKYALDGEMPDFEGLLKPVFHLIKASLDTNEKKYLAGLKGGRPKKNKNDAKTNGLTNGSKNGNLSFSVSDSVTDSVSDSVTVSDSESGNGFPSLSQNNFDYDSYWESLPDETPEEWRQDK